MSPTHELDYLDRLKLLSIFELTQEFLTYVDDSYDIAVLYMPI